MKKRYTVAQLAKEKSLDIDEALVTLWDCGFNTLNSPDDFIPRKKIKSAKKALGIPTKNEFTSCKYWMNRLNMNSTEFMSYLGSFGIKSKSNARKLPKGALAKLLKDVSINPSHRNIATIKDNECNKNTKLIDFEWKILGHIKELRLLNCNEVIGIHYALVDDFSSQYDPIVPSGVRSEDLLASAVFRVETSLGSEYKYPTVEMAGASLLHAIVQDHPFHNGNKRTALVSLLVFLDENGFMLTCDDDQLFKVVIQLSQHRLAKDKIPHELLADAEVQILANFICHNSRLVERGDRPIQWRRLRQILNSYDCELAVVKGNKINISRKLINDGFWRRKKTVKTLYTQVSYGDEGRDVEPATIQKIRKDLQLNDKNGIDSKTFYEKDPASPGEFINRYRKVLKRLASL